MRKKIGNDPVWSKDPEKKERKKKVEESQMLYLYREGTCLVYGLARPEMTGRDDTRLVGASARGYHPSLPRLAVSFMFVVYSFYSRQVVCLWDVISSRQGSQIPSHRKILVNPSFGREMLVLTRRALGLRCLCARPCFGGGPCRSKFRQVGCGSVQSGRALKLVKQAKQRLCF